MSINKKYPPNPYSPGSIYGLTFKIKENLKLKNIDIEILSFILFNTPNSPFFTRFLSSDHPIASGFCPNVGFNPQAQTFTLGFQNLNSSINLDDYPWFDRSRLEKVNYKQSSVVELKDELLQELIM